MNYKSQLRGWAIDRAIELAKVNGSKPDMAELASIADALIKYAYVEREDLESTAKDLFELVRTAPANQSSVDALIGTLEHIKQERTSQGLEVANA